MLIFSSFSLEKELVLTLNEANKTLNIINKATNDFCKGKKVIVTTYFDVYDTVGNKYNDSIKKIEEYEINPGEGFIYRVGEILIYNSKNKIVTVNKREKIIFVAKPEEELKIPQLFSANKSKLSKDASILFTKSNNADKTILDCFDTIHNYGQSITYFESSSLMNVKNEYKIINQKKQTIKKQSFEFVKNDNNLELDLMAKEYLDWSGSACKLNSKSKSYRLILIP